MAVEGFFSICEGDPSFPDSAGMLQVRCRAAGDLDRLREAVPGLGPTIQTPVGDYEFRAFVSRDELAKGIGQMVHDINYSNFKNEVAGVSREHESVYHRVWTVLLALGGSRRPWGMKRGIGGWHDPKYEQDPLAGQGAEMDPRTPTDPDWVTCPKHNVTHHTQYGCSLCEREEADSPLMVDIKGGDNCGDCGHGRMVHDTLGCSVVYCPCKGFSEDPV